MNSDSVKLFRKIVAAFLLAGVAIWIGAYVTREERSGGPITARRASQLFDELTTTPERQQVALDKLVLAGDAALPYVLAHLDDQRRLATKYVRFLNSSPTVSEQYFNTLATTVDEAALRLLCWHTESCDPAFPRGDEQARSAQIALVLAWCHSKYGATAAPCDTIKKHGTSDKKRAEAAD